ncbi:terminase large subunit [Luteipulveratus sp. YIM 133132]|uniref:terminase large subunit n=1 Tax=Luteipulveratus flavus TaxID=3031728 RepID=UPI0023B0EEE3|nr:terminase large subunit [Luteipulveratus sp. YIM 133132]MDE9364576.1 terminase large subunit [Luteipulveratus sp. YIM 133132]
MSELLTGSQTPTHRHVQASVGSRGEKAVHLALGCGIELDPWQRSFLVDALAVTDDGAWAAASVGLVVSRQNGKSVALEVMALAGLFLFDEQMVVYTAHKGETVMNAFGRLVKIVQRVPALKRELAPGRKNGITWTNGKEQIELRSGAVLKFRTRTADGGRGLSGDRVILDEAQDLRQDHIAALLPVQLAKQNPQTVYAGSAGDSEADVLGGIVHDAERKVPDLCFLGWSAPDDVDPDDRTWWARVNPGYGTRIPPRNIATLRSRLALEKFLRECMGVGDYPRPDGEDWVIPRATWRAGDDDHSAPVGPVCLAVDAKPDGSKASLALAGYRSDGGIHVEIVQNDPGLGWISARVREVMSRNEVMDGVVWDAKGPLSHLRNDFEGHQVPLLPMTPDDLAMACAHFYEAALLNPADDTEGTESAGVEDLPPGVLTGRRLRHREEPALTSALASVSTRKLLDRWMWRRQGKADVSPVVAATFAVYGLQMHGHSPAPPPPPVSASESRPRGDGAAGPDVRSMGF